MMFWDPSTSADIWTTSVSSSAPQVCNNCGFTKNPQGAHYCAKCGNAISGDWKVYDGSIYKIEDKQETEALKTERKNRLNQIDKLNKEFETIERESRHKIQTVNYRIGQLIRERDALRLKTGNKIADWYEQHLEYLSTHKFEYYIVLVLMIVISLVISILIFALI